MNAGLHRSAICDQPCDSSRHDAVNPVPAPFFKSYLIAIRDFTGFATTLNLYDTKPANRQELCVIRSCETSSALGPSYTFEFRSPVSCWFRRLRL